MRKKYLLHTNDIAIVKIVKIAIGIQFLFKGLSWTSLAVQWLRLPASTAGGTGSIPGRGTKILHATQPCQKIK